jgi:murein DD-endopeptidase MepM/ murein hydrolase activator NlpD
MHPAFTDEDSWVPLLLLLWVLSLRKHDKRVELDVPASKTESTRGEMLEPYGYAEATVTKEGAPEFVWPVPVMFLPNGLIYTPKVSSGFGVARSNPKPHTHAGIDIMFPRVDGKPARRTGDNGSKNYWAPPGTPVLAARAGKVAEVTPGARGTTVIVGHGNAPDFGGKKLATIYRHLVEPGVKPGDQVDAGDVLGLMGFDPTDSGKTRHLHFEVWVAGKALNPESLDMQNWGKKSWHPTATTTS